jgi:hypothetical protein
VVPVTLLFRDAKGTQSHLSLQLPVSTQGPGPAGGHKH